MMTRRSFLALLGGAAVAGAAAGGYFALPGAEATTGDPKVRYGKEPCRQCGMIISDERFAAAWRSDGDERHFDDIGCMVSAYRKHTPAASAQLFVRDFTANAWLDAAAASYVAVPDLKSPMSYDVAAFGSPEAAKNAMGQRAAGPAQTWTSLLQELQERG